MKQVKTKQTIGTLLIIPGFILAIAGANGESGIVLPVVALALLIPATIIMNPKELYQKAVIRYNELIDVKHKNN